MLSRGGRFLAAQFDDCVLEIFRTDDSKLAFELPLTGKGVMALSPEARWLAIAHTNDRPEIIRLWDWQTSKASIRPCSHDGGVTALMFSPDGRLMDG